MTSLVLRSFDPNEAQTALDEIVDVYLVVHADDDSAFFNEERYRRQLAGHMNAPSWQLVAAMDDTRMAGYIYGFALPPSTAWWHGLVTDVPAGFTNETGERTVAISELLVRQQWRRQGVARALHDEFLAGRKEDRATLLVRPDNDIAKAAYSGWGWSKAAELRPAWEHAPTYDVLVIDLGELAQEKR